MPGVSSTGGPPVPRRRRRAAGGSVVPYLWDAQIRLSEILACGYEYDCILKSKRKAAAQCPSHVV